MLPYPPLNSQCRNPTTQHVSLKVGEVFRSMIGLKKPFVKNVLNRSAHCPALLNAIHCTQLWMTLKDIFYKETVSM